MAQELNLDELANVMKNHSNQLRGKKIVLDKNTLTWKVYDTYEQPPKEQLLVDELRYSSVYF